MKFSKSISPLFTVTSNFRALADVAQTAYCTRIAPVIEAFYSSASHREKLEIRYANIRV